MRLNRYVALGTGLSRRQADDVIIEGRVKIGQAVAILGIKTNDDDVVTLDGRPIVLPTELSYIIFHKPTGYITSRTQQGNTPTIYALLPKELHRLKPVGRLDRDTSGLLLLTDDGEIAFNLSHPSQDKVKRYEVILDKIISNDDVAKLLIGIELDDGLSRFDSLSGKGKNWKLALHEGRNRQIRRTFSALNYEVRGLHRSHFGTLDLNGINVGSFKSISKREIS